MIRRWLRAGLVPSALCLTAVGCTSSVESLTGGLIATWAPAPKDGGEGPLAPGADEMSASDQVRLHLESARQMDKAGDDAGALDAFEHVLKLDKGNLTAMRRLCVLYDRRGGREDFKKAEELYQQVAKARPKDADVWNDWGYSLYLRTEKEHYKENWAEAEKKLRQALKLDPQHSRAHANLGLVLGQLGRYDEALREFRAAHLSESEAHCDMAFVYVTKGMFDDAKQECRIAREKDPSNSKPQEMLAALEQPPRARDKGGVPGRADGRTPRASTLTPAQWEAEHEKARRAVLGLPGTLDAAAPAPGDGRSMPIAPGTPPVIKVPAPAAADTGPSRQSSQPIVLPSGSRWMPVNSGSAPAGGTPGTIEY